MINKKYFFIGIGGIGMSSIAQYLYEKGNTILGYDASENKSVKILELQREGKRPQKINEFILGSLIKRGSNLKDV